MLTNIAKRFAMGKLLTPVRFNFGGGHHEIDYQAVVTKNMKSGIFMQDSGYYLNPNEVARRISRIVAFF